GRGRNAPIRMHGRFSERTRYSDELANRTGDAPAQPEVDLGHLKLAGWLGHAIARPEFMHECRGGKCILDPVRSPRKGALLGEHRVNEVWWVAAVEILIEIFHRPEVRGFERRPSAEGAPVNMGRA